MKTQLEAGLERHRAKPPISTQVISETEKNKLVEIGDGRNRCYAWMNKIQKPIVVLHRK